MKMHIILHLPEDDTASSGTRQTSDDTPLERPVLIVIEIWERKQLCEIRIASLNLAASVRGHIK